MQTAQKKRDFARGVEFQINSLTFSMGNKHKEGSLLAGERMDCIKQAAGSVPGFGPAKKKSSKTKSSKTFFFNLLFQKRQTVNADRMQCGLNVTLECALHSPAALVRLSPVIRALL